jgi:nicotinamide mononucleotide transporter
MHLIFSFYDHMLGGLNHPLFLLGADHVSSAEILGFITGAWAVWLTAKVKLLNFPVGIANSLFFMVLFLSAHLFADGALQVVYVILGVVGWWQWVYGGPARTALVVRRSNLFVLSVLVAFVVLTTWGLTLLLGEAHDIAPFWDALTTALSLAAQWLLNYKRIENWFFWIAADLIYVPLYFVKHLDLTGIVYVLFLAMCFLGLSIWRRAYHREPAPAENVPSTTSVPSL